MPQTLRANTNAAPQTDPLDRWLTAWALLCGIVLCGVMAIPFYRGLVYTSDDLWAFHLPLRHFYAQCLTNGERFDWSPYLFSGFYVTGEGQVGTYHPLHWLLYSQLSLRAAFDLELLLSYPWMLAGTYLFFCRIVPVRSAALVGALSFTFSGFNLLHFVHPNAVAIVAHIPWLLWGIDRAWRATDRRTAAMAEAHVALLTASQLLLGYPQYVWFSLLLEAAWLAFLSRTAWNGKAAMRLVLAKLLGLLAGAVQLLPTLDALAESQRSTVTTEFALSGSLHPLNFVQLIAPYLFTTRVAGQNTHELGLYAGCVPLMLVIWLFLRKNQWHAQGPAIRFACLILLCSTWLALGSYGYLYRLQTWLPLVGNFRMPARYIVLVHFSIAMLCAHAFALLVKQQGRDQAGGSAESGPLWRSLFASVAIALIGPWWWKDHVAALPLVIAGPLLLAAAAWLLTTAARGSQRALIAIVILLAADLGAYGFSYAVFSNTVELSQHLANGPTPEEQIGERIATSLPVGDQPLVQTGNHLTVRGWRQVDGYAGLTPRKELDYGTPAALRAAAVTRVLKTPQSATVAGLVELDETWLEVPQSLPRARLVSHARVSQQPREEIDQTPLESVALVERSVELGGTGQGNVTLLSDRPGSLELEVETSSRQLLVIAESFHSGWQASIDGQRAEVLRVNGDFLGCVVDAGRHRVSLEFRPASLWWGRRLSLVGVSLIALCLAVRMAGSAPRRSELSTSFSRA